MSEAIEITGLVIKKISKWYTVPVEIILQTDKGEYFCICPFFCPIEEGDSLHGNVNINTDTSLKFIQTPFVQIPVDKESLINYFCRILHKSGFGRVSAEVLYNKFETLATQANYIKSQYNVPLIEDNRHQIESTKGVVTIFRKKEKESEQIFVGSESVIAYISEKSLNYYQTQNLKIIQDISGNTGLFPNQIETLLKEWYKNRQMRRLYLLGLTKKEIKSINKSLDEIYKICIFNPFIIPQIPIHKAENIFKSINGINPNFIQITCGNIVRDIYNYTIINGWTCVPLTILYKKYYDFDTYEDILVEQYEVVIEYNNIYLLYQHEVETSVAKYINSKIEKTVDKMLTNPDGVKKALLVDVPGFESAIFFNNRLVDEQKLAIQAALIHDICIITGGAGCGKCLEPNTPILMYNGTIQIASKIQTGDLLMGDDSSSRKVLGTCIGIGDMYEIIPEKGRSFGCNAPHILTLKGKSAIVVSENDIHSVFYTFKGVNKSKIFENRKDASIWARFLQPDIFDISLEKYLKLSIDIKKNLYLFHKKVEFPFVEISENPESIGKLLGSSKIQKLPIEYKINSENIRLKVLNGIISCNEFDDKCSIIVNTLVQAEDIEFLAFSVGWMAEIFKLKNESFEIELTQNSIQPFKVLFVGKGIYSGFELNGNGRFLLSDFTVTHNTSILKEIVQNLQNREISFMTTSFTGTAVVRIQKSLNCKFMSATMDRMIAKSSTIKPFKYLIIDETSMVTTELFFRFITTFKGNYKIIIVGDINQLQPIGWGSFMKELKESGRIPVYTLCTNHRILHSNLGECTLLENANELVNPERDLEYPMEFTQGFSFSLEEGDISHIGGIVHQFYEIGIPSDDICIICPYNAYLKQLNEIVQNIYLKDVYRFIDKEGTLWCIGDRIMKKGNNYDINVFNGEEGKVIGITPEGIIGKFENEHLFLFEGKDKKFDENGEPIENEFDDELTIKEINHSFAVTVDKKQGGESAYIIGFIPQHSENWVSSNFLNLNRLYTLITRTQKLCYLIGFLPAIQAATTKKQKRRYDNLCYRLKLMRNDREDQLNFGTENNQLKIDNGNDEEEFPWDDNEDGGGYWD